MSVPNIPTLFYEFLQQDQLLSTCHIRELEAVFVKFISKNDKICESISFFQVVYELEYAKPPLLSVSNNGFVIFKKRIEERAKLFNIIRSTKNKEKLLKGNGSVEISCESPSCQINDGHFTFKLDETTSSFLIAIRNVGTASVYLKKCLPLRDVRAFAFSDRSSCTMLNDQYGNQEIKPGEMYNINVTCHIKEKVARYDTDLFFTFKMNNATFRMLRLLTCTKSNKLVQELQPTSHYAGREKFTNYVTTSHIGSSRVKIKGNKLERARALLKYEVPNALKQAVIKKVFSKNPAGITLKEREWRNLLQDTVQVVNYSKKFSLLLYLEELQAHKDIRMYDMKKVTLKRSSGGARLWLEVPGLAEKRPSVIVGDVVYLHELDPSGEPTGTRVEGSVYEVHLEKVLLGISERYPFPERKRFDVVFTFSRFQIQLQHRAVRELLLQTHQHLLFPEISQTDAMPERQITRYFNSKMENNPQQMSAIAPIVYGTSKVPYIIYGPPGTGKTVTLVEAITQVVHLNPKAHVLVCSPSNSATDLLAERLLENVEAGKMFRMCATSREYQNTPKKVQPLVNYSLPDHEYFFPSKLELGIYNVLLTTLITAGRLASAKFPSDYFDFVFIDEAGYATEPECMTAVAGLLGKNGRLVMAGDPKQLGPVLYSRLASLYGLGISYLERISKLEAYQPNNDQEYDARFITKLVKNYRSHKAILQIPNECFYSNELEECADPRERNMLCGWEKLPAPQFPIIFHSIKGKDLRESNSPSYFNLEEAVIVVDYVQKLLAARGNGVTPRDIGILSPYRKQTSKIRHVIKKEFRGRDMSSLKIGSVEEFQGQERRVIIISTVRSSNEYLKEDNKFRLGFLSNPKRFNVAITRAKSLLIVVGDPDVLCRDFYWRKFIKYCVDNRAFIGVPVDDRVLRDEDCEVSDTEEILQRMHLLELEGLEEGLDARREE